MSSWKVIENLLLDSLPRIAYPHWSDKIWPNKRFKHSLEVISNHIIRWKVKWKNEFNSCLGNLLDYNLECSEKKAALNWEQNCCVILI